MEVQAVWKKNYQVEVIARQFRVPVDEAPEFHGDDTGMMPTELFLSSLASCFCLALVYVARKKKIEVKDMRVNVRGQKNLLNFIFSKLTVEVDSSLPSEILEDIISLAKKYCFVSNTISKSCPIEYVIATD
ncbi:MAG TPA: OsmC family protein [Thermodesulfobacteriota bacterium]|nr:OsmC family protein [Thermodesulfobacteriota bacterium]